MWLDRADLPGFSRIRYPTMSSDFSADRMRPAAA